jgi:NADH-quinone oxidoreductase subunit N
MDFSFNSAELLVLMPEIILLTMATLILVIDAFLSDKNRNFTYQLAQISLLITAVAVLLTWPGQVSYAMSGTYVADEFAASLKLAVLLMVAWAFIYSRPYLIDRDFFRGEYYVLGLFAVLGMLVMISAANLLTIYLGLELLSLSMYVMVAMHRDSKPATEAAMKYFVLGAIASGMLLYGMSIIYGATGSLDLRVIAEVTAHSHQQMLMFGLVFIMVGLAFKFGAVPFHQWVPDVYQGAPTAVTLFIASAPKIAAFAMLIRLLAEGLGGLNTGFSGETESVYLGWQGMLIGLAVLSIVLGNLVAIVQTNIKRMFAYSTISHVGFLFMGALTATATGYAASMFYVITYALMSLAAFGIIILLSRRGFEADQLDDFKGLNQRSPWYAFLMLMVLLSMAGIPPLVGFWAKLMVLSEVIQAGFLWLAIVAVLFSVIGAFYYLRVIKMMYFDSPQGELIICADPSLRAAIAVNGLLILGLGLYPGGLMSLCLSVFGI